VPFDSIRDFLVRCAHAQIKHGIERLEAEEISVCSGRRSRPLVSDLSAIILALHSQSAYYFGIGYILGDVIGFWRNVVHDPMCKSARPGCIWVMHEKNERLRV
jgi:hypothetical protein